VRTAIRHLTRVGAAVAVTAVLVGSSAHATTTPVVSHHDGHRAFTPVPGHNSSEWLMMGLHCGASLS
jgi:Spy/CpxP family protein refolding chaperone